MDYIYLAFIALCYLGLAVMGYRHLKKMEKREQRIKNYGKCPCDYPCCEYCYDKAQEENGINEHQIYK